LFPLFATSINDTSSTCGKFTASLLGTGTASVVDSGGKILVHLALRISLRILEKNWNYPIAISRAWGRRIHEKKPEEKIS
jgi:hypothetical protein